jgi:hypothetical protein
MIAFAVTVLMVSVLLTANLVRTMPNEPPVFNAKLNDVGYLAGSKLFLLSANATYGTHNGQECFIIDATVRNDYTAQQPPPLDNLEVSVQGQPILV